MTETIGQNNVIDQSDNLTQAANSQTEGSTSAENQTNNLLAVPLSSASSTVEINTIILNSVVEPLSQYNNESSQPTEETETDHLISSSDSNKTNSSYNFVNSFKCSGADWGLSWFQLLCFSLLLGFAGPIIYILYIAESSAKHHSS